MFMCHLNAYISYQSTLSIDNSADTPYSIIKYHSKYSVNINKHKKGRLLCSLPKNKAQILLESVG
jgi:hypothetical protein